MGTVVSLKCRSSIQETHEWMNGMHIDLGGLQERESNLAFTITNLAFTICISSDAYSREIGVSFFRFAKIIYTKRIKGDCCLMLVVLKC